MTTETESLTPEPLAEVVIGFAGDSGDGMQLTGDRFTDVSAAFGNDLATLPNYPAEIRAPAGTIAVGCGWILWRFLIAPLQESLSGTLLAAQLEQRYPDLRGRLVLTGFDGQLNALDPATGRPLGYLLVKDLISLNSSGGAWTDLVRPLVVVKPDDDIESTLLEFQRNGATICLVQDGDMPVGIATIEDIMEQVIGRMEDEYPRHSRLVRPTTALRACAPSTTPATTGRSSSIPAEPTSKQCTILVG